MTGTVYFGCVGSCYSPDRRVTGPLTLRYQCAPSRQRRVHGALGHQHASSGDDLLNRVRELLIHCVSSHTFRHRLNTTLLSRFFLNLRGAALAPDTRTLQSTSDPSETHFTSVVFGNLGGSLALGVEDELEGALEQAAVGYDGEICEVEDNTEA